MQFRIESDVIDIPEITASIAPTELSAVWYINHLSAVAALLGHLFIHCTSDSSVDDLIVALSFEKEQFGEVPFNSHNFNYFIANF